MKLTVRPLTDRSFIAATPRTRSQFTTTWSETLEVLEREVYALQTVSMPDPVLMLDCTEADFRLDGQLRAHTKLASNAVALAFESRRGPLVFRADRYHETGSNSRMKLWQHNVRAIALTLKALRDVDRYGATSSGEQYVGYRQLEAKGARVMTPDEARKVLFAQFSDSLPANLTSGPASDLTADKTLVRIARREAHPDRAGGSRELWDLVQEAAAALGVS